MQIRAKRIYEPPAAGDGYRVLIDGMWPRGISRERGAIDDWARELAPSAELRRWYGHQPERFDEFDRRYRAELGAQRERLTDLRRRSRSGVVTLVFAARDAEHSNARRRAASRHFTLRPHTASRATVTRVTSG